jgi:hypothetical protein
MAYSSGALLPDRTDAVGGAVRTASTARIPLLGIRIWKVLEYRVVDIRRLHRGMDEARMVPNPVNKKAEAAPHIAGIADGNGKRKTVCLYAECRAALLLLLSIGVSVPESLVPRLSR